MNDLENQIYHWFLKRAARAKSGRVLSNKIVATLCGNISGDPLEVRRAMERLRRDGKLIFTASPNGEPVSSYIAVSRPEKTVSTHAELWRSTLDNSELGATERLPLNRCTSIWRDFLATT